MRLFSAIKRKTYSVMSRGQRARYFERTGAMKLHLGCGKNLLEGWLNTDLKYRTRGISYLDVTRRFPFRGECFDFIFCEHVIEHLTFSQAMSMLRESYRVLKPGGVLRLATPSLRFVFDLLLHEEDPANQRYVNWAARRFLGQAGVDYDEKKASVYVISNFFRNFEHQVLHSRESLESLLLQVGFGEFRMADVGKSDIPELCMLERHGTVVPDEMNRLETFVVEAKKQTKSAAEKEHD